jgi:signal transduction histidine kinase
MRLGTKLFLAVLVSFTLSVCTFLAIAHWLSFRYLAYPQEMSISRYNLLMGLIFFASLLVFILCFSLLIHRKIRYIRYLQARIQTIAKQDWAAAEIDIQGNDELAQLAHSLKAMSQELKEKIEAERRQEQLKSELITNLSHDLRSPLTSMIGFLQAVQDQKYESREEHDEYIQIAYRKAEQLKRLIEDLFVYTKLHNHALPLNKREVNLTHLLWQFLEESRPQAEVQGHRLSYELPEGPIVQSLDVDQWLRVLENLFSNALAYSQPGSPIQVKLWEEGQFICLTFANQTEGMEEQELSNLFERLYRRDKVRSIDDHHAGLGLAIVKSIVELHGATITAHLNGDEICFQISLPQ